MELPWREHRFTRDEWLKGYVYARYGVEDVYKRQGSGSNQSNHMYKLGPIHQGAMERGAKTTSDSYILWPARVGAFSLVMGRDVYKRQLCTSFIYLNM